MIDSVWTDLRFATRMMRRSPGFTAIVVLTLAFGIGANTALFTVVNAVLFKPLPVRDPSALTLLVWDAPDRNIPIQGGYSGSASSDYSTTGNLQGTSFPYVTFERLRQAKDTFSDVFAFRTNEKLNVVADGQAEVAFGQFVSGNYYDALGVHALRGRMLGPADDSPDAPPTAVITWRYWQRRFGGDPSVIGKTVTINAVPFTIVGISPPEFAASVQLDEAADFTVPLATEPLARPQNSAMKTPSLWWLRIMARLQPGVTRRQAQARIDPLFEQSVAEAAPASTPTKGETVSSAQPGKHPHVLVNPGAQGDEFERRQYHQPLAILMAIMGMMLLIACINAANLLLARSSARQQEFTMRVALGARRSRLVRQMLTESLLVAAVAGLGGIAIAVWGKELLLRWTQWIRGGADFHAALDLRVLAFTALISALTGIACGLAPAFRAGATQLAPTVKVHIGASRRSWSGRLLIAAQVAVSLVLLVGAGLFVRTLRNLNATDAGFDTNNLLLFGVRPDAAGYTDKTTTHLYDRMIERLRAIPGVEAVALSRQPLLAFTHRAQAVYVSAENQHNGEIVEVNVVSPDFFDTLRIPLLMGRPLRPSDTPTAPPVVVVNQAFARAYFVAASAVGQQFWLGSGGEGTGSPLRKHLTAPPNHPAMHIVGVVRDAKYTNLRTATHPTVYEYYGQFPTDMASFEVRYRGDQSGIASAVRAAVRDVDSRLPIFDLRTQREQSEESIAEERMFANLSSSMGGLTLLLAAVGLYGTISYSVGRRTTEIGVRRALGALQSDVLAMVLRESVALAGAGIVVGIPLALLATKATSKLLNDLLFGVRTIDPLSFTVATATMVAVALLAAYLPARRASRIDPMAALRSE